MDWNAKENKALDKLGNKQPNTNGNPSTEVEKT
jgi:hypothetical protein